MSDLDGGSLWFLAESPARQVGRGDQGTAPVRVPLPPVPRMRFAALEHTGAGSGNLLLPGATGQI